MRFDPDTEILITSGATFGIYAALMATLNEGEEVLLPASEEIYGAITYDGLRHVGYCAAPRSIVDAMYPVLQQSSRGPATFVQDAAVAALRGPQDCVGWMREEYGRRRRQSDPGAGPLARRPDGLAIPGTLGRMKQGTPRA